MSSAKPFKPDPKLDLVLERVVDVRPELVWAAWTQPKHMKKWFTPAPWKTIEVEVDLRPGGRLYFVMQSPEGEKFPNTGCFLEVVKNERLTWTNALLPGYRPASSGAASAGDLVFTAVITMKKQGKGTKYTALAIHRNEDDAQKHAKMGFQDGWGKALDQLVTHAKKM
jgi:uncharacterized protein YndB with AHSA1/START domain